MIDQYNYGVSEMNMSIDVVKTDKKYINIEKDHIRNPFFVGINGGSLKNVDFKEIYSNFKHIYILCCKTYFKECENIYNIYDLIIDKENINIFRKNFKLITASLSVLRNFSFKTRGCIVNKNDMEIFFDGNFDNTEIVIPLFELNETMANLNISLYDNKIGIENMSDVLSLSNHFNKKYKKPIIEQFINIIGHIKECNFWSNPENCEINMTEVFKKREFNYQNKNNKLMISITNKHSNPDTKKLMNTIASRIKTEDNDYLNMIDKYSKNNGIYEALQQSGKRTYYIENEINLKINSENLTKLICSITDEFELYNIINIILVSKDYCHMLLNIKILDKIQKLFDKYKPLYKILFGYTWLTLLIEESIMKTQTTNKNRFVLDINTANKLPQFPFLINDISQNPYLMAMISKDIMQTEYNAMSLNCLYDSDEYYGVCTLEQFKWRFNLMVTRNPKYDIFKNINWSYFAISGSVISACLQKKSPLFDLITLPTNTPEENWLEFFNQYYKDSDIDMMCNDPSIYGFIDRSIELIEQLKKNMKKYEKNDIIVEPIKSMAIILSKTFFTERLNDFNESCDFSFTTEDFIQNIDSLELREYLYNMYVTHKIKFNNMIRKSEKDTNIYIEKFLTISPIDDMYVQLITNDNIKQYDNQSDCDMSFYVNDFKTDSDKVSDDKNFMVLKICENIKFKISSTKFYKTIELFRSRSKDFFNIVAKFHLPCVRAYYQGNNVYILPSCITSMMTGINIDYKYFAGIRDPINIINKYRMRGFGTILTIKEIRRMEEYNLTNTDFNSMFKIDHGEDIDDYFSAHDITSYIFKPELGKYEYRNPKSIYINTMNDLKSYYNKKYNYNVYKYGFNLFALTPIENDGSIKPYQSWIPIAYYNMYNKKK